MMYKEREKVKKAGHKNTLNNIKMMMDTIIYGKQKTVQK